MNQHPTDALADLAHQVGTAFLGFAEAIRTTDDESHTTTLETLGLGKRQQEIAELPGVNGDQGMRAAEIAAAIDYDQANTHTAVKALAARGVLEEVPGS